MAGEPLLGSGIVREKHVFSRSVDVMQARHVLELFDEVLLVKLPLGSRLEIRTGF